jgi:V/A-type H+-transporting ATPase subunit E
MEIKLENLIEKIKKDGIEEAQHTSDEMITEAKQRAASIISQAKKEAEKIVNNGRRQAEQFKVNSEADLQHATRNAELLLMEKINSLFDKVFKRKVAETLTPDFLKEMILKIVKTWADDSSVEIVINNGEKKKIEALLFSGINEDLKKSISLKASNNIAK